ncbi:porin family protein [Emticicia aquatica]|nr:porin family protein [Emticicia aquatica]
MALLFINAKIITAQTLSIGPMVGLNVSTLSAAPNTKNLLGLTLGGFANYSVNDHFGLGAKIMYSQLGSAYNYNDDLNRLHYIQIPLTAVYYFGDPGATFRPKVFAGPYLGTLLRANHKSSDEVLQTDGTPMYNKIDIGGLVGLGFNYRIQSRTWLNVDAGFGSSFTDVTKTTDNIYHNLAFGLNVGVSFPVSKD